MVFLICCMEKHECLGDCHGKIPVLQILLHIYHRHFKWLSRKVQKQKKKRKKKINTVHRTITACRSEESCKQTAWPQAFKVNTNLALEHRLSFQRTLLRGIFFGRRPRWLPVVNKKKQNKKKTSFLYARKLAGWQEVRTGLMRMLGASIEQNWPQEPDDRKTGRQGCWEICLFQQSLVPIASRKTKKQNLMQETRGILFGVTRPGWRWRCYGVDCSRDAHYNPRWLAG